MLLHAALFLALARVSSPPPVTGENAPPDDSLDVDLLSPAPPPLHADVVPDPPPPPDPTPPRVAARTSSSSSLPGPGSVSHPDSPTPLPSPDRDPSWSLPSATPPDSALSALLDDIVLGRRNVFVGTDLTHPDTPPAPAPAGPPRDPAPLSAPEQARRDSARMTASLREGLLAADAAKGLGVEGPVPSAASDVVRRSDAPVDSRVVFAVSTDGSGAVTDVRVASASPAWDGWSRVASDVRASLAGRKLAVHEGTAGVDVKVEVSSADVLPDGAKSAIGGVPAPGFIPPDAAETPAGIPPAAAAIGFAVHFEPSDLGVPKHRVVHAHLVSERYRG